MTTTPSKEALVIILDVSSSMKHQSQTSVEDAKKAVLMLVQNKMLYCKSDEVGLVLMGTRETKNPLHAEFKQGYNNISVMHDVDVPNMEFFKAINNIQCEGQEADLMDAIVVATDQIHRRVGAKKYAKRIFLVTDAGNEVKNKSDLKTVLTAIQRHGITLFVIGLDFQDDPDETGEDEDEWETDTIKRSNERVLYFLTKQVGGLVIPVHSALQTLATLRSRTILQRTVFRDTLSIADSVHIPIWGYLKTQAVTMPSLKKSSGKAKEAGVDGENAVRMERTYFSVDDPDEEVDPDKKIKAYQYGKSWVPFSKVDVEVLKFTSQRGMKLIGFASADKIHRDHFMGSCYCFIPAPGDEYAARALSALVHAMYEMQRVAIVRYVRCRNAQPMLAVLHPCIKTDTEFFYMNYLPFSEDLRHFQFRSFDSVKNSQISNEQFAAAEHLITKMNLMKADMTETDEDGEGTEALKPKNVFNPVVQHFYQGIRHRALHPDEPLPALDQSIASYSLPWQENGILRDLLSSCEPALQAIREQFPITPADTGTGKEKKKYWFAGDNTAINLESYAQAEKPLFDEEFEPAVKKHKGNYFDSNDPHSLNTSSLNTSSAHHTNKPSVDILSNKISTVGTVNPVKDFNDMFNRRDEDLVDKAIAEMQAVIRQLLRDSIGNQLYQKAADCIVALRAGCIREEESEQYNGFLRNLKQIHSVGRRSEFWDQYIKAKDITLIHQAEAGDTDVTPSQAQKFLVEDEAPMRQPSMERPEADVDDILDELE
eukprot:TRINITY_DN67222_c3_g2_i1.p1 TRINITY_DN67222_c3_g2~~TRINITY_DN67222_c3_g2_i1.p1  ORF type:complete len:767 (+),score=83.61 TRINITY_DN67222_c3_g2_i1:52-2352(+)